MKIALLMSGGCRQSWLTAPSLNKYVVEPNDADVFLYLNKDSMEPLVPNEEEVVQSVFPKNVKSLIFTDEAYNTELNALVKSNYAKIDALYAAHGRTVWDKQINWHNTDQYLKLSKCCQSAVDYATKNGFVYDLILRCRPDIGWLNKFDLSRPIAPGTVYCNQSMHRIVNNFYDWIEDTCFFSDQNTMLKICSDFSDKMVNNLEICGEEHDLSCATEKLLARCIINTGVKIASINSYFNYTGTGWIRPKLSKHHTDWTKSPNYHLVEKACDGATRGLAVYFDRISEENVVMDPTIIP